MSARLDQLGLAFVAILIAAAIAVPLLSLAISPNSPFYLPPYLVQLLGKYLCYAILAVALDLVWGYCGILSLGHGAFFALGGYAMGMYLMRQIGTRGVYANPILPDFMVFLNWKELPVAWWGFNWFPYAMAMVVLVPGLLALAFGWFAFRSRVTGVYLSIITQAMTFALFKEFFRNDFGFGGNNGLTDFKDLLGFSLQSASMKAALFSASAIALIIAYAVSRAIIGSKYGKALMAVRDAESRMRFLGYRVANYKLFAFVVSAVIAGIAGALYVPQVGIINPSEFAPGNSIEAAIWVAVGGRGTLIGAALGAVAVNFAKTFFTGAFPEYWLYGLGLLFVLTTLFLPKGLLGLALESREPKPTPSRAGRGHRGRRRTVNEAVNPTLTQSLLYLDGVSVSFDGYKALRSLSLMLQPGEMRAIIGPNGAGKTTMMDVITGKTRPDEGEVMFDGRHDLTKLDEAEIATLGVGRKFQKPTVFENHTVEDNLLLATKAPRSVRATLFGREDAKTSGDDRRHPRHHPACRSSGAHRRIAVARAEAMARDRHAAGAGPEALACRRTGRRHDRRRDRGDRRSLARNRARSFGDRGRARHAFRARARRQGDMPSRGLGAGRGHARPGERRPARRRSLSGAVNAC